MKRFTVTDTKMVGQDTLLLSLTPKHRRDILAFEPGQYAAIGFKRSGRPSPMRCFSLVSSPHQTDELQFALRVQGDFTRSVAELQAGDTVFVRGPFGDFTLYEQYGKSIIMLAGGIGITPFVSMARYAVEAGLKIPMTLLYGCRSQQDIAFKDELLELERRNPYFKVVFFVSQGPIDQLADCHRQRGRIDEDRLMQLTGGRLERFSYFICGPKGFTHDLSRLLVEREVPVDHIVTEEFTSSSTVAKSGALSTAGINRWAYGLTGASLVAGAAFFMALDLARVVPASVSAQSAHTRASADQQTTSPVATPTTTNPTPNTNTSSTDSSTSSAGSSASSSAPAPAPTYTAPQPTQTYQQPVSSVS